MATTSVPVPRPCALCVDPEVIGAPFYIMSEIDGRALASAEETAEWLPNPESRRHAGLSAIDVMARLHRLDVEEIGLGDLSAREDYLGRQLHTWRRSWDASLAKGAGDDPRFVALHGRLVAGKPQQRDARVVHGDYAFHNLLIDPSGNVVAVVDWELTTLGDPLSDLGYALSKWSVADAEEPTGEGFILPAGFPTRAEAAARYGEATGADLSRLDYYVAFNFWRAAGIAAGVSTRYRHGQKAASDDQVERFAMLTRTRLGLAEHAARRAGL
jgi:aminoglycoside phosphotransferase (APT) family kinase protein